MTAYPDLKLYIGGAWRKTSDSVPVLNPADENVIGAVPVASRADLDDALAAAREGFRLWSRTSPRARGEIMLKAAALMRARIDEIAHAITLEHGKPFTQAQLEVIRGCEFFEWDAAEGQRTYGRVIPSEPGIKYVVMHQPIGMVAAFSPWNFPMSQPARKIAGALAAGCSIILKAAEETPAGALHIARALHDAGLPPGVFNLVFGVPADISSYLIPQEQTRLIAFTGSTAVGKHLTRIAADHMKPVLMELGGHAPVIVCDDVDPVAAATASAIRKSRNTGQVCTSPTRFFVQKPIYEAFARTFAEKARSVVVGNGLDSATQMGPLANHRRIEAMETLVADARAKGARVLAGGERIGNRGYFFPVTVLADVPDEARAMREEPFGPLALISPVSSLDEAIEKANSLPFGLAAYAFTHSASNADRLADGIEAGNVSINTLEASVAETPFGGVKDSGYGREGGAEGLAHYTVIKNISHRMTI
ncbi:MULTISPECIES: NAD-dependent succinate-semialdehyde dehydrogenase [unclassified Bosea (in: a-proteobacteria)]|uniref:NAD-dependent succinate-semialdehyde dehydrogenase n=1 Tax=unclassified Bosea (in: a-proteobacteria) TaxID=2653178 RepID=UPI000F74C495|nr:MULTISPECIES: NAD-dependent succinate-semialdehyde dehydrogenase [unclassified Bosea (in: a-proteobacteria)]AZO80338.1 NAD-dependent succinate-semialdehyde dehydrogenase [Bosea sp. Tri-49]RXT23137.1 NAD-dependent succinate-semialdehyde dehydrogenase [Bosea sp. Tri-39]RXT38608.1 NAD-dependent succinate-semialdehyde dehydrogenase [Bosea sp. Tri-54]